MNIFEGFKLNLERIHINVIQNYLTLLRVNKISDVGNRNIFGRSSFFSSEIMNFEIYIKTSSV